MVQMTKCTELGWKCVPLATESYVCWETESWAALGTIGFSRAWPLHGYNLPKSPGHLIQSPCQFVRENHLCSGEG